MKNFPVLLDLMNYAVFACLISTNKRSPKSTISMPGSKAILYKVSDPEVSISITNPIAQRTIATENIPNQPNKDNPRAPLLGIFSATKDSIVGQK